MLPTLSWLAREGVSTEDALRAVGLAPDLMVEPLRPVPLVHVATLLRNAAREFGPDLPYRIVASAPNLELAMLGKVGIGARTPGEVLSRVVAALPYYCSHEQVTVRRERGAFIVSEFFAHKFDEETNHLLLQYAAAMVDRILGMAGEPAPHYRRLEIPAHPVFGIAHLREWFGDRVFETKARSFTAVIDERIVAQSFDRVGRDRVNPRGIMDAIPLRGDGTLSGSVKFALATMIAFEETPTMRRVVAAAGISVRSFQRQLDAEGTTFSELLGEVRRHETLKRLNEQNKTIATIAAGLGYSDQASFTRAFRRWTGTSPSQFRARTV